MNRKFTIFRSALAVLVLLALMLGMTACQPSNRVDPTASTAATETLAETRETSLPTEESTAATEQTEPQGEQEAVPEQPQEDYESHQSVENRQEQSAGVSQTPQSGTVQENQAASGQNDQPQAETTAPAQPTPTQPAATQPEPTQPAPTQPAVNGQLKVHFIDVGQADAALVQCDGMNMLIDGGNAADSNLMYAYLKKYGVSYLDYVIGTHAHEDHIGGLAGALNYAKVGTVYCPVTSYNTNAFTNFANAVKNQGKSITVPSAGTSFSLGGASVTILAVNTTSDVNNSSIVLRITYGSTSFLFTGDAEREVEQAMMSRGVPLSSTVLKVGHHGSSTSSSYQFLWNVMPKYAVISVGKGNTYGHPTEAVLSRLRDAGTTLYRTDMQGDIICTSNGSSVSFTVSRNANADTFGGI